MFTSFILAALCCAATPMVEPHVKKALESVMLSEMKLEPREFRVFTFALMLILAAVLTAIFQVDSSAFLSAVGGLLGVSATRLFEVFQKMSSKERPADDAEE